MKKWIYAKRFELLLFALFLVIFNRIFFFSNSFYSSYVWPFNMVLLGLVSMGIFHDNKNWVNWLKNCLFVIIVLEPIFASEIFANFTTALLGLFAYIAFYLLIFIETLKQITKREEVSESVVYGSLSGFLLLVMLSTFSFIFLQVIHPESLNNIQGNTIPEIYHQITYFSSITLSTIGYGDITPASDNARLLAAFWGIIGQFYMVTIVAIIVSKFTAKR